MSSAEEKLLKQLSNDEGAIIQDTFVWSTSVEISHQEVVGAVKSLLVDAYITAKESTTNFFVLSKEGEGIVSSGESQEISVFKAVLAAGVDGIAMKDLDGKVGKAVSKIGMGNCMKAKWIGKNGANLIAKIDSVPEDSVLAALQALKGDDSGSSLDSKLLQNLKRRKLISSVSRKSYEVARGPSYSPVRVKKAADLTKEMLDNGTWKETQFKSYNFLTLGEKVGGGYLHPLLKVRAEFRKILMQMGFQEMPTNKWVESSFWNFDSLFQPQSHPARDAHDTFFIKKPAETVSVPEDYYERVKEMHEKGGSGSIGYRYDFKKEGMII